MIESKYINKIIAGVAVMAFVFCGCIIYSADTYGSSYIPEYQKRLFNGEIVMVDIQVNEDDWQGIIDKPEEKNYISVDLIINGERFNAVGLRTKGNSSITKVSDSESGRYSLNIKMNKYVKGQTCYGLDTFCVNNIIDDMTYMKEYISYDIMNYIGVPAPLANYAKVTVNGEDYGFMLLLERYDQAFLDRVYNTSAGYLYNVKRNVYDSESGTADVSGGGSLLYSGNEISSYSSIFDNAVFGTKTSEEDMQRVITAIKNLNDRTDLEQYWDIDGVLRYFAAHIVIGNLNSYISDKEQNYYLYEYNGKLTVLPWSYHGAFGGKLNYIAEASDSINLPIDTPVYGVNMEDRPLLNVLLEIPEYKEKYYEYLYQIIEGYFDSGLFETTIQNLDAQISEYVKNDVSSFYSYEQYEDSLSMLTALGYLRAESITGQLNAYIPSTEDGQNADSSALIDVSNVNIYQYPQKLFNGEVAAIDIQVDDEVWDNMIQNAQAKEWISADLVINGELFSTVGVRTKGNSSLSQAGGMGRSNSADSSGTSRYSLQFKMNKYVQGQKYYGLDSFCVNNMMGDATYMKDYIAYDIMKYIGVAAPLTNYTKVTVNGEDYGFGIMLERYDKSFMDRNYSTLDGYLYSVKIQMGQRDNFAEFGRAVENTENIISVRENQEQIQSGRNTESRQRENFNTGMGGINRGGGGDFGGFGGSNGGSLAYTDDELSSYSSILDNAVFGTRTTEEDMQRIVTAIKNLNEVTNLEDYWDVDGALRYFAAHTVVVNLDSYVSNMQQNYYLYEKDGRVTILPWDYNLAFGGYQGGSASSFVNFPIDTPVSGVNMEDRPLLNILLEIPEYKEKYHSYLREIVEGYFYSGVFENTVRALDAKINGYVKNDVNVYFTYEQYETALPVFIEMCMLRAESIEGQLDGTIPSTTDGQREDSSALIDSSSINMSELGSMGGGMRNGGEFEGMPNMPQFDMQNTDNIDMDKMQTAMEIIMSAENGELSDGDISQLHDLGFTDDEIKQYQEMFPGGLPQNNIPGRENRDGFIIPDNTDNADNPEERPGGQMPDMQDRFQGGFPQNLPPQT